MKIRRGNYTNKNDQRPFSQLKYVSSEFRILIRMYLEMRYNVPEKQIMHLILCLLSTSQL